MADRAKKISELTAANTVANTDYLLIVTNTAGTAVTKRIGFSNAATSVFTTGGSNIALTIGNTTINGKLTTTGNTVAAQINATSLNVSGLLNVGNSTVFTSISANSITLPVDGALKMSNGYAGSNGQLLSSNGTTTTWISVPAATTTTQGGVKIDGTTITIANGVISVGTLSSLNVSSNTINLNSVAIITGSASTRLGVNTQIGSAGSNGSIYLSTAGKIYLKVANTGVATNDWQRVTTTSVD